MAKIEANPNPQLKTKLYLIPSAPKSLKAFLVIENHGLSVIEIAIVTHPIRSANTPKNLTIFRIDSEKLSAI